MRTLSQSLCAVLLLALPAAAQQYPSQARGLGGAVAYQTGDVDHVNLFNGQLSITLPLGQGYPVGPGLGAGLAFTYTSNLWDLNELQTCRTPGGILSRMLEESVAPETQWTQLIQIAQLGREAKENHRPGGTVYGSEAFQRLAQDRLRVTEVTRYRTPSLAGRRVPSLLLGAFTEKRVSKGGQGQTAIEEFCFDESTGFLERHRTLAGVSRANSDLLQVMTIASTGHVETELFHGGDSQSSMENVYSNLCEMSLTGLDAQYQLEHTWAFEVPQIITYAFETDFTWNHLGLIDDIAYPDCLHTKCSGRDPPRTVSYDYSRGFLTAVPGYASSIAYQGGGMVHQIQHTNGVTYTVEREGASALDRPFRISTSSGWSTGAFAYDGAGAIKQIGTQDFRYDRFKRVTSGEVTVGAQDRVQSAAYDVYGNLLSLTTNGSTLTTSTSSSTNRLTSFSALYDAGGNLTRQIRGGETHQYTFDPLGVMKYLQSTTDQAQVFLYDADDERLATYDCFPGICDSPGWELRTTVRGLGGEPLREYLTQGVDGWHWVRDYVYRGMALLSSVEPNGQGGEDVSHFHLDHLGTPRQITNAGGAQVALHSYYPFGQEATVPTQTSFTKKFTGHERDVNGASTLGELDYMHARYCSPTLGRFLSFDPIGGNRQNPQSWNRYAYALDNPMNYTDPEGLSVVPMSFMDLYFIFDEITIYGRYPWDILTFFRLAGTFFSDDAPAGAPEGKHILGHNNYIEGRSILRADPERLATRAGTGDPVGRTSRGRPGFKERVDFGEVIGDFVEAGVATPTTKGIITYAADGTIHIVPVRP